MEKTITKTIVMTEENYEHCKRIADELENIVNGDFINIDENAIEVHEDENGARWAEHNGRFWADGDFIDGDGVSHNYDDKYINDIDTVEQFTVWDWFNDCLDVDYVVDSALDYRGVRVCVAWGGPSIYIDTMQKKVLLYWWTDYAEYELASEVVEEIDAVFAEYYEMRRC